MNGAKTLRLGIIGLGAMGHPHVGFALDIPEIELTAVCDIDPARIEAVRRSYYSGQDVQAAAPAVSASALPLRANPRPSRPFPAVFSHADALIASGLVDAVLIATPHYDHEPIAVAAFAVGLHVLTEKPVTVTVQGARRMVEAWKAARIRHPGLKFGGVFMQRTYGHWQKIKTLIDNGDLGPLVRATWIVTDWFRTEEYYRSGGWRATWRGEGGGVLTNQCPHNLDLLQWFFGMPESLSAFGGLGKHHRIAVEDEVAAFLKFPGGATGQFITTTAESPGTNRLEIVGEKGKLVFENGALVFHRNASSMREWSDTSPEKYRGPDWKTEAVEFQHHGESGHQRVVANFARSILFDEPLVAPAEEGVNQVILTNAMMVSLLTGSRPVTPAQADEFEALLEGLKKAEASK